jgi:TRAP-type mannitol/chloroaromatic compound transport system permease small subunit
LKLKYLRKVLGAIDAASDWAGRLSAVLIPAMMLVMTWEVVARYLLKQPTIWAMEISQYFFLATTVLGGGYLLLHGGHVSVGILYNRLNTRTQAVVSVVTSLFFYFFILALLRSTWVTMVEAVVDLDHSPTYWGPPIYPVYCVMSLGIVLTLMQGLAKMIRDLITAITGKKELSARVAGSEQGQDP